MSAGLVVPVLVAWTVTPMALTVVPGPMIASLIAGS